MSFCLSRNSVLTAPFWAKRKLELDISLVIRAKSLWASPADLDSIVLTFVRIPGENEEILHCLSLSRNWKSQMGIRNCRDIRHIFLGHLSGQFSCHHNISLSTLCYQTPHFLASLQSFWLAINKQREWERLPWISIGRPTLFRVPTLSLKTK